MFDVVINRKEIWSRLNAVIATWRPECSIDELTVRNELCKGIELASKFNDFTIIINSTYDVEALNYLPIYSQNSLFTTPL